MKHFTFSSLHIHLFVSVCLLLGICFPTNSHAQTTHKKWKALKAQADTLEKQGKYEEALPLRIQEKDLALQKWGKWSKEYGTGAYDLGAGYRNIANMDSAVFFTIESTKVREKLLGKENIYYLNSIGNLGMFYAEKGEYNKTLPLFEEGLSIEYKISGINSERSLYDSFGKGRKMP